MIPATEWTVFIENIPNGFHWGWPVVRIVELCAENPQIMLLNVFQDYECRFYKLCMPYISPSVYSNLDS